MNLTTLSDWQAQVLLAIKNLAGHNSLGAEVFRHSSPRGEEVEHLDAIQDNVNCQQLRNLLKRKVMSTRSTPFLHHPNSSLDLRDVLVSTSQIDHRSIGHRLNQNLQGRELATDVESSNVETLLKITLMCLFEGLKIWGTVRFAK